MPNKPANKAIIIYPEFDTQDTFWSYAHSLKMYAPLNRFGMPKRLLPPLGLLGLYNHLKPYYHELSLIDKNVDPRPLETLIKHADHVYMGGMLAQEQSLLSYAGLVKTLNKTLIIGGTAITPDSPLLEFADYAIENEAEGVIDELLAALANGQGQGYYKGGWVAPEQFFQPDFSAIDLSNYVHMAIQISRGCPERCEFCDIPYRFGKAFRVTPKEKTEQAIRQLYNLGWRGQIFIVDDNFIGNPRKALPILRDLYEIGEKIAYHHPKYTELTLRLADDTPIMAELRAGFKKAHFINGFYGVETPNTASLRETQKLQNLRGDKTILEKLHFIADQTGSGVMMGMIYGFDHDTDETVQSFIDFVNASNAPIVMAGLLNALPFTGLMSRMKQQGRLLQLSSGNNSDGVINFIPYQFSVQQAERNYLTILEGIYQPKAYFKRVMRHLALIDLSLQSDYRKQSHNSLIYLGRILSRKHAGLYWRYLPQVLCIAIKKRITAAADFNALLAEYFSLCGQYTHFRSQIDCQSGRIKKQQYQPEQLLSWRDILHVQKPPSPSL